jgi:hypothetical protein
MRAREAVDADEREESRPDADDEVGAKPRLPLAQLSLDADHPAEEGSHEQPKENPGPADVRR